MAGSWFNTGDATRLIAGSKIRVASCNTIFLGAWRSGSLVRRSPLALAKPLWLDIAWRPEFHRDTESVTRGEQKGVGVFVYAHQKLGSRLAIIHFSSRGGELTHGVSMIDTLI